VTQGYTFLCTLDCNVTQYFITLKQAILPQQYKQKTFPLQKHKVFICPILFNIPHSWLSLNFFDNTLHTVFLTIYFSFIKYYNQITYTQCTPTWSCHLYVYGENSYHKHTL